MIRYRDKVYWDYFIHPETGMITDVNGNVLEQKIHQGYCYVMLYGIRMPIHCIQAHTYYGFIKGNDVHHLNEIKTDNDLYNLDYSMTHKAHTEISNKNEKKIRQLIERNKTVSYTKGCKRFTNGVKTVCCKECPEGFVSVIDLRKGLVSLSNQETEDKSSAEPNQ